MSLPKVCIHDRVEISKKRTGRVAFIGFTYFALEPMYGIVLDKPLGKNNGKVKNRQYFICDTKYGIFVKRNKIKKIISKKFKEFDNRITICDEIITENYGPGIVKFVGILDGLINDNYSGIWYGISLSTPLNTKHIKSIQTVNKNKNKMKTIKKQKQFITFKKQKYMRLQTSSSQLTFDLNDYETDYLWQKFDGKFNNIPYFYCRKYQGVFARQQQLILMEQESFRYIPPKMNKKNKRKSKINRRGHSMSLSHNSAATNISIPIIDINNRNLSRKRLSKNIYRSDSVELTNKKQSKSVDIIKIAAPKSNKNMLLCDNSYESPYEMNDITNIITNNSCSIESDLISKLSINNSYICRQSLTLSNTLSATSNISFAISEEDGLSQGIMSPHNENEYFIQELIKTNQIESINSEYDSDEYNNNNNNNNIMIFDYNQHMHMHDDNIDISLFHKIGSDILIHIISYMTPIIQYRLLLISKDWYQTLKYKIPIINKNSYCIDNTFFNMNYNKCLINSTANQHSFLFKDKSKMIITNTFNLGNNWFGYFINEDIKLCNQIKQYAKVKKQYITQVRKRSMIGGMMASLTKSKTFTKLEKKYKKLVMKKDKIKLFSKLYHWEYLTYFLRNQEKLCDIYSEYYMDMDNKMCNLGYKLRNITILTLSNIHNINSNNGIGKFIGIILSSKYSLIKYVSICNSLLKSKDIIIMCKYIQNNIKYVNKNLFELVLKNNLIDDKCIIKLLKTIGKHLIHLCHLDLSHNFITDKTCNLFAKFLNKYTVRIPKGGHYYLAINNPPFNSDNDYKLRFNNRPNNKTFEYYESSDGDDSCNEYYNYYNNTYEIYDNIYSDNNYIRDITSDPNKCTSLCQINIKKCKNIGSNGIASLIAMFVNPSKSKIRFRITKGNNNNNNIHSKILTHSNWRIIAKYYEIRNDIIIKWEKILNTQQYDLILNKKNNINQINNTQTQMTQINNAINNILPPLPQLQSMSHTISMNSDNEIISNKWQLDEISNENCDVIMNQSIELNINKNSLWKCNKCNTNNLNLFYKCTHCHFKRVKKNNIVIASDLTEDAIPNNILL